MLIDTSFDVRTDAGGKDPDTYSPTLCRYHQLLWDKPLPGGVRFALDAPSRPPYYLHHRSDVGEYWLSSDSVVATFTGSNTPKPIVGQLPAAENEAFVAFAYTIGGFLLWPANRVTGRQTINGARGFRRNIADRIDLTLECVRRHYRGEASPLGAVFALYADLFALFEDFRGYVDFWLLPDLVTDDYSALCSSCRSTTSSLCEAAGPRYLQRVSTSEHRVRRRTQPANQQPPGRRHLAVVVFAAFCRWTGLP